MKTRKQIDEALSKARSYKERKRIIAQLRAEILQECKETHEKAEHGELKPKVSFVRKDRAGNPIGSVAWYAQGLKDFDTYGRFFD
jgi:hypothetical protein